MSRHKLRVGKNVNGWFVAIPQGWGGYDVIEDVGSFDGAMSLANHITSSWGERWRWM